MNRTLTLTLAIALISALQTGCDVANRPAPGSPTSVIAPEADTPQDTPSVTLRADARAELEKRRAAGKTSWQITYNGTCSGAPSLGIYSVLTDIDPDATIEQIDGIGFVLDRQTADLVPQWGPVIIRCMFPGSSDLIAEFAERDLFQQP